MDEQNSLLVMSLILLAQAWSDKSQYLRICGDYEPVRSVFKFRVSCGLPVVPRAEDGPLLCFVFFLLGCLRMYTVR